MSDKIEKIKPDKVRKRTIASLEERKGYAEMIKYEKADYEKVNKKYRSLHHVDMPRPKFHQISARFINYES